MNVNKLLILGLVSFIFYNYNVDAYENVMHSNITYNTSTSCFIDNSNNNLNSNNKSFHLNIINQVNKYQQIQNDGINTMLQYLLPILQVFVSTNNNKSQNDLTKAINYINAMSGLT